MCKVALKKKKTQMYWKKRLEKCLAFIFSIYATNDSFNTNTHLQKKKHNYQSQSNIKFKTLNKQRKLVDMSIMWTIRINLLFCKRFQ